MSKARGNPGDQPFCVNARRNLTKKNAWWQRGNNNNPKPKKQKDEQV